MIAFYSCVPSIDAIGKILTLLTWTNENVPDIEKRVLSVLNHQSNALKSQLHDIEQGTVPKHHHSVPTQHNVKNIDLFTTVLFCSNYVP